MKESEERSGSGGRGVDGRRAEVVVAAECGWWAVGKRGPNRCEDYVEV